MADEQHEAPSTTASEKTVVQQNYKKAAIGFGIFVAIALIATVAFGVYRVFSKVAMDGFSRTVASVLRLPAIKVNGVAVLFTEYANNLDAIKVVREYDRANPRPGQPSAANFTDEELSDQVLALLVSNVLTEKIAQELGITVTAEDLKAVKDGILTQLQTEAAIEQEVKARYGWTYAEYEKNVVHSALLKNKVSEVIATDVPARETAQAQAQSILDQIKQGGSFEELAKQYSDDGSGKNGGQLSDFTDGEMYPSFEEAVKKLAKGKMAESLVETQYGYHIIRLNAMHKKGEKIIASLDDKGKPVYQLDAKGKPAVYEGPTYNVSHILIMYPNMNKVLNKAMKDAQIHLYLNVRNPFKDLAKVTGQE